MFWNTSSFQNLLTLINSELESFHDFIMVWLTAILILVLFISFSVFSKSSLSSLISESQLLEVSWTVLPILILISIAFPSIYLLCVQDSAFFCPFKSVKVISNQWNWQSDQSDNIIDHLGDVSKLDELSSFDSPLILPFLKVIRFLVTSSDVLHSLGVPSLGVKLDSNPGRLNAVIVELFGMGLLTGSCYELCGSGHSAMPLFFFVI